MGRRAADRGKECTVHCEEWKVKEVTGRSRLGRA